MLLMIGTLLQKEVLYINTPRLLDKLRPNGSEEDWIEKCMQPDILVLDDLGQEKISEWVLERLYIIINERYTARKKTIITSNLPITEGRSLKNKLNH